MVSASAASSRRKIIVDSAGCTAMILSPLLRLFSWPRNVKVVRQWKWWCGKLHILPFHKSNDTRARGAIGINIEENRPHSQRILVICSALSGGSNGLSFFWLTGSQAVRSCRVSVTVLAAIAWGNRQGCNNTETKSLGGKIREGDTYLEGLWKTPVYSRNLESHTHAQERPEETLDWFGYSSLQRGLAKWEGSPWAHRTLEMDTGNTTNS